MHRVALLSAAQDTESMEESDPQEEWRTSGPPVEDCKVRNVKIEDIGEQGEGIARVARGYVIIVPETEKGERVTVETTNLRENVAFS